MNFPIMIKYCCENALKSAFPEFSMRLLPTDLIDITEATQPQFGHYQCNSAMKLVKRSDLNLNVKNPRQIAEKLVLAIEENLQLKTPLFSKIEIAGPGFINFTLDTNYLSSVINEQLHDSRLGVTLPNKHLKVVIDYSSVNIAKEMHVGHLRTTIIGDCLARVFRFLGHNVLGLNHLGDWGTQFGMLIAYIKTIQPEITENAPVKATSTELVQWYKASKQRFDNDAEFKTQAQQEVVALQSGNPVSLRIWKEICDISRQAYEEIYKLLDIKIVERGESFYNPHLPDVIAELEAKKLITISEGAKCIYLEGFTNREGDELPLIVQKKDGGYNYATTDLAALRHRVQDEKADWIIYVVDAGQTLHFQMVFAAAKKAEFYNPNKVQVDHVPFGLVLGPDGKKFKTRSGDTEKLIDLIQGAIQKAKTLLLERHKENSEEMDMDEAATILGINAIKYADLSCHRLGDYVFSYDKMLKFEGNTAAFLLYAYVRIQSIQRKVNSDIPQLIASGAKIVLEQPEEIALGLLVCQFSEVLDNTIRELLPSRLTDYLYTLAEKFHLFFHQCRVEGSPQQNSRLLLCKTVSDVMHQGLSLLGLKPLERM